MKKRLLAIGLVVLASVGLYVGLSFKQVPSGYEAVHVLSNGDITVLPSGVHFLTPGAKLHRYPVGVITLRVPESGTVRVRFQDGAPLELYFDVALSVPAGASRHLYERFSADFEGAFRRLVTDAAELVAASTPSGQGDITAPILAAVGEELRFAGITVTPRVSGEPRAGAGLPASADVAAAPPRKLIVVGVDGGDWLNIRPMVENGELPGFARLLREGATGPLRSIEPMLSPLLWTTMATGRYPEDHGILNFTVVDPNTNTRVPISRLYRKADAWWNMLSDAGRSVCVAGWLATDPAEPINGVMVTDKVGYLAYASSGGVAGEGSVHPDARRSEIAALVVRGTDIAWEQCSTFVDVSRAEFEAARSKEFDARDALNNLILLYATTQSYRGIALHLLEKEQPDLLAVYFELVDAVSHLFMLHAPPRMADVPEAEYRRYHRAVDAAYREQDRILGEMISGLNDDTILMVVSDHGFKAGESRLKNRPEIWAGNAAKWHRLDGIVAFFGNGVRGGQQIAEASILDVAPTILALQGLPRAADMPGKILATAFTSELQSLFNANTVTTLGRRRDTSDVAGGSTMDAEAMKKLEALGYLTPDNADAHNNLGQRYQERGNFLQAIEEYRKALALRPGHHAVWNNLAVCYGKLKQYGLAEEALLKTIELKPDDFYAMNNLAVTYMETGKRERALEMARRAVRTEPSYANGHVTLGSILAMSGNLGEAETAFREALRLDPENRSATINLQRLEKQRAGG